jgi:P4 family phage/plasmid primase-like protien
MKYKKVIFDDIDTLLDLEKFNKMPDDEYDAFIENPNNINTIFDEEIQNLKDKQINVIKIDKDIKNLTLSCIVEDNDSEIIHLYIRPQIITCDENGKPLSQTKNSIDTDVNNVLSQYLKSQGIIIQKLDSDGVIFDCPLCKDNDFKCKMFYNTGIINAFRNTCSTEAKHVDLFRRLTREAKGYLKEIKKAHKQEIVNEKMHRLDKLKIKADMNLELYEYSCEKGYYTKLPKRKLEKYIYDYCSPEDNKEYRDILGEVRNDYKPEPFAEGYLMNMENGIYNIKEDKLLEKDSDMFFTYVIPAKYDPSANSELLYNTVRQIFDSDEIVTEFKKALGYSIHDTCMFEKGFILRGTKNGANGKDTILGLLVGCKENNYRGLFSHLAVKASITDLNDTFSHSMIENKKVWFDTDYNEAFLKHTAIIRKMISGSVLKVREPFKEFRYIEANCKPWIACNTLPKLENNDGGWWRRWQIFDCQLTFGGKNGAKKDPTLKFKLNTDVVYSTLFNWVIEGYKAVENYNITDGEFFMENDAAIDTWKKQANNIVLFIDEECNINPDVKIKRSLLYKYYKQHCLNSGTKPLGKQNFYEKIIYESAIYHKKSNGVDWLYGIEMKGEFEYEDNGL